MLIVASLLRVEVASSQSVVRAVSQGTDDAEEKTTDGSTLTNGSWYDILEQGGDEQIVGMRFQNVTIPAGATITAATIQFQVKAVTSDVAVTVTIVGEDIDDAPTFTTTTNDISDRTQTTASASWVVPHWDTENEQGTDQVTADFSSVVQEIIDRGGWSSGNDIVIMLKDPVGSGYRQADTYDSEVAAAPEITITYSADTTPPSAPVITQPSTPTGDPTPTISGTASEDGGTIELTSNVTGVLAPTATVTGGAWSIELTTSLVDGAHALTATHTDDSDNESAASGAKTLVVDAGPTPVIASTETSPTKADPVPFTIDFGEAIDTGTFTLSDITVNSGTKQNLVNTGNDQNWTFEVASPTDGSTLTVSIPADVLTDTAANNNLVSNTVNLDIDRTAPSAPVVTQPTTPTGDTTPDISGTGSEDGGAITLTSDLDGVLTPTATVSSGAWSLTVTSALSSGTHSITATHTDAAGNVSSASGGKSIEIVPALTVAVSQSSDDVEQDQGSGNMNLGSTDLEAPFNGGSAQYIGMRFQNITVPAGATITNAEIQFTVESPDPNVAITLTFKGEDIDDAPTFTSTNSDLSDRTETTASVDWAAPYWGTDGASGADQLTPDLSSIIQEIIDRGGWASGNDIVIMVKSWSGSGTRSISSYDASGSNGPELTINYSPTAYRSKGTGNWSSAATWERYDGAAWVDASVYPDEDSDTITIQSPHTVTVDSGVGATLTVDQVTIDSGGTLVIDQKTIVAAGPSTDFTVAGQLTINASKEFNPSSTSTVSVSSGGQITNNGTFNATGTSSVTFGSGSTYVHSQNGGAFPQAARTTWSSGSTASVTGATTTVPTELGDSFHHFTWNSASQTAALDLNAAISSIGGDLTITSTGSGTLSWVQSLNTNLTITGNYVQTGGTLIYTDGTGTGTMSATDVSVTGGTLTLTTSTGTPTLDIDDDLVVSGGGAIDETGAGSATITFTGSAQQDVTAASGITDSIDITVNNTGGILLLSDLSAPADLTATSGDIDAGGYDIYVGTDLTISTDLTNGAAVIFNGASGNQNVTYSSGTWSIPSLDVNKAAGSLLLGTDVTITTTSCVTSGTLDVNGQTLTFPTGTTLYSGGTVTGNVVFERNYALVGDGWRMIASPLDGVNYSSLNTNFHTQGAPWADQTGGTATLQAPDFAAQDWTPISGADASFTAAQGYIFYMYEELLGSTLLPATWSVTGTVRSSANKSLSWNTVSTDSYNYVGNRTTGNIDWDAAYAASTNVASTYSTWDPALTSGGGLTGYKYYNQATGTGLAGRYIAPFTAFMVEPAASGGTLVFSTSCAANQASANYFGKRENASSPHVRLMVEGEGHAELETYLVFESEATDGADRFDAKRMRPLSNDYVTLVSMEGGRSLVYDTRSMADGGQEYTLGVAATRPGLYTLTWPDWHEIPDDWAVTLHDRADGRRVDLRKDSTFVFQVTQSQTAATHGKGLAEIDARPRFTVRITPGGRVATSRVIPDEVALSQNYPNPFNPVTTIPFGLPDDDVVSLEIFDLLGRRVSRLLDHEQMSAGWHEVQFEAGYLTSGTYLVRVQTERWSAVRRMVLLR